MMRLEGPAVGYALESMRMRLQAPGGTNLLFVWMGAGQGSSAI